MIARRFSCPPVHEAAYDPREIPNATKDMKNTVILRPSRQEWLALLGELVQITNEAVRRRATSLRDASKPLSLEYMADRMDVDDPLFGYLACTKDKGWLQGYVTCTTFTTWHRGFQWDSTNECLELHKSPHAASPPSTSSSPPSSVSTAAASATHAPLAVDADGALTRELMTEVFAGDPDNEGVVWPHVAELSLLGALGCGRWLVQLVIDGLETPESPYRWLVAQATDGSIPFYERMGFVRVGAVTSTPRAAAPPAAGAADAQQAKKKQKRAEEPTAGGDVVSPTFEHTCEKDDTCASVAARYGVDVFDVVFLNQRRFPRVHKDVPFRRGTTLTVPRYAGVEEVAEKLRRSRQTWHECAEDTPLKSLAASLGVDGRALLDLNRASIKGLQLSSVLKKGTRVQTGGPSDVDFAEYCHWTFPDDDPSKGEPSYMMARRLKPREQRKPLCAPGATPKTVIERTRALLVARRPNVVPTESRRAIFERIQSERPRQEGGADFGAAAGADAAAAAAAAGPPPRKKLFNRVVRIEGEEANYKYWFVLTFLPDLQWCHVAPLHACGVFGDDAGRSAGRPRWMLVPEDEGGEIDVGAARCVVMEAREMKGTHENADEEEWDIVGDEAGARQ